MQMAATATPLPRRLSSVGRVADDATAGRAERVPYCNRTAVDVDLLRVQFGPEPKARERLGGKSLVEFNEVDVGPGPVGPFERAVGGLDGRDAEHVGIVPEYAAACDARQRLGAEHALAAD